MIFKTGYQRMRREFEEDGTKVFRHFCLLPRIVNDGVVNDDTALSWCQTIYKVLCWNTHGGGGNTYWKYFQFLSRAKKCAEENTLY